MILGIVFGATGQVGRELMRAESSAGAWIGLTRSQVDITDSAAVERALDRADPALVVNAAAFTAVDKAESETDRAFAVNRDGPANLAAACARRDLPLIHISTDYVFDGRKPGAYVEDDPVSPLGAYARSKEAGERAVRERLERHVILRTAWVYSPFGQNFVRTMLRLGKERDELGIVADQRGCPTSARSIAGAIAALAHRLADRPDRGFGTYHYVDGPETTWHGFATEIFRQATARGARAPRLKAIATADYPTPAKRPANSVLACGKIRAVHGIAQNRWHDELSACLDELLLPEEGQG